MKPYLKILILVISLCFGVVYADVLPDGNYMFVKFPKTEMEVDPLNVTGETVSIQTSDGLTFLHLDFGRGNVARLRVHMSKGKIVFFLTPDSGPLFENSVVGEVYRGQILGDSVSGSFSDAGKVNGVFRLFPIKSEGID